MDMIRSHVCFNVKNKKQKTNPELFDPHQIQVLYVTKIKSSHILLNSALTFVLNNVCFIQTVLDLILP